MIKLLDLNKQYIMLREKINVAIQNVIDDTAFINGKYAKIFENNYADYLGVNHCIGVGNGTDALEIAIEALNLPKGSEIIVPVNSFIASAECVSRNGHRIVFADIGNDYNIDILDVKKRITKNTKAIIVVHLYGNPCNMDKICEIAKDNQLFVIEDCAQAHGAKYLGKKVGTFGDISTFSFYPGKNLGAYGDAGCIITDNENLAIRCRMIANHGRIDKYNHIIEGRNSRLDGIQAGILNVKLDYLNEWNNIRRNHASMYFEELSGISNIILPLVSKNVEHVYHQFVIRTEERDVLQEYLKKNNIETGIHYPISLNKLEAFAYLDNNQPKYLAEEYSREILSLPISETVDYDEMQVIIQTIKKYYKK